MMVQEFHVLRCFTCLTFQVQQVKKVNRWSCKLCGEKQSLLKEFGRGSGADCRRHVQKLNAMRGAMMEEHEQNAWSLWEQVEAGGEDEPEGQRDDQVTTHTHTQVTHTQVSCWSKYLDTPEEAEPVTEEAENVLMDRQQLCGNNLIDRKRKRSKGWTDREGQDSRTPEQANWSNRPSTKTRTTSRPSLNHTSPPTPTHTSPPSLNHTSPPTPTHTSPPSLNHTSPPTPTHTSPPTPTHTSPPSKRSMNPPSVTAGSRWARFLSSDSQVKEEMEDPSDNGRSQSVGGAVGLPCNDIISQSQTLSKPRPSFLVSSMFQSGDEFNFDDDF